MLTGVTTVGAYEYRTVTPMPVQECESQDVTGPGREEPAIRHLPGQ
jgi:hypothetical protein